MRRAGMVIFVSTVLTMACWSKGGALEDRRPAAGVGPPPELPLGCGGVGLLADDFSAEGLDTAWTKVGSAPSEIRTGDDGLSLVVAPQEVALAGVQSNYYFDLRGDGVFVEVGRVVDASTPAQQALRLARSPDERIEMRLQSGDLFAVVVSAGSLRTFSPRPFDPAAHRYWQLRESGGRVLFQVSANARSWDTLADVEAPKFVARARLSLVVGTNRPEAGVTRGSFRRLNGAQPKGGWCSASLLRDDFGDRSAAPHWLRNFAAQSCRLEEDSGGLYVVLGKEQGHCAYVSAAPVDLRDSALSIEVEPHILPYMPAIAIFRATDGRGSSLDFDVTFDRLSMRIASEEVSITAATIEYDPAWHRYWRLRERTAVIYFDTSPEGKTWFTHAAVPAPFAVDALEVHLQAGLYRDATETVGEIRFDNLNRLPTR